MPASSEQAEPALQESAPDRGTLGSSSTFAAKGGEQEGVDCATLPMLRAGTASTWVPRPASDSAQPADRQPTLPEVSVLEALLALQDLRQLPWRTAIDAWAIVGAITAEGRPRVGRVLAELEAVVPPSHDFRDERAFTPCAVGFGWGMCRMDPVNRVLRLSPRGLPTRHVGRSRFWTLEVFAPHGERLNVMDIDVWHEPSGMGTATTPNGDHIRVQLSDGILAVERLDDGATWRLALPPVGDHSAYLGSRSHFSFSPGATWIAMADHTGRVLRWRLSEPGDATVLAAEVLEGPIDNRAWLQVDDSGLVHAWTNAGEEPPVLWGHNGRRVPLPVFDNDVDVRVKLWAGDGQTAVFAWTDRITGEEGIDVVQGAERMHRVLGVRFLGGSADGRLVAWETQGRVEMRSLGAEGTCGVWPDLAGLEFLGWSADHALQLLDRRDGAFDLVTLRETQGERRPLLWGRSTPLDVVDLSLRGARWLEVPLPGRILAWDLLSLPPLVARPLGSLVWSPGEGAAVMVGRTSLTRLDLGAGSLGASLEVVVPSAAGAFPGVELFETGTAVAKLSDGTLVAWMQGADDAVELLPSDVSAWRVWRRGTLLYALTRDTLHLWDVADPVNAHRSWPIENFPTAAAWDEPRGTLWYVNRDGLFRLRTENGERTHVCDAAGVGAMDLWGDGVVLYGTEMNEAPVRCDGPSHVVLNARHLGDYPWSFSSAGSIRWSRAVDIMTDVMDLFVAHPASQRTWSWSRHKPSSAVFAAADAAGTSLLVTTLEGELYRWWLQEDRIEHLLTLSTGLARAFVDPDGTRLWIDEPTRGLYSIPLGASLSAAERARVASVAVSLGH